MNYRHIAFAAALVCAAVLTPPPAIAGEPRAVIELFTSQGCSSCPPADRLMGELAHDPSLVTMSLPVDYWDYLGWKDTLALHGHSNRQRAYAITRGDREVYTPQAVVNGVVHVLGSDKAAIERAIAQTRRQRRAADLAGDDDGRRRQGDGERAGGQGRARQRRSLAVPDHRQGAGRRSGAARTAATRSPTQCGAPLGEARRLERQGGDFQLPLSQAARCRILAAGHRPRSR